jgi:hypothetical protein
VPLSHTGRAEKRDGRLGQVRDGVEALQELVADAPDVQAFGAVCALEDAPVFHEGIVAPGGGAETGRPAK